MFGRTARHILWFPFLLLALTVILAVTIVVVDQGRDLALQNVAALLKEADADNNSALAISEEEYKTHVAELMERVRRVSSDSDDLDTWKDMRNQLVATRVPSSMRDVHIQLVAAMNQQIAGMEGDPEALADAAIRLNELKTIAPWLR